LHENDFVRRQNEVQSFASGEAKGCYSETDEIEPRAKEFVEPPAVLWIMVPLADNKTDTLISS
jgi:hypothetical protein